MGSGSAGVIPFAKDCLFGVYEMRHEGRFFRIILFMIVGTRPFPSM